jgi:hypothetical protein
VNVAETRRSTSEMTMAIINHGSFKMVSPWDDSPDKMPLGWARGGEIRWAGSMTSATW